MSEQVEQPLVLSLVGVKKEFAGRSVLGGIDLELREGECLALLGPNGAGKSTTIRIALGLSPADEGRISVLGFNMPDQGHLARAMIGVVPQYDALDPDFTVLENLLVFGGFFQIDSKTLKERSSELVEFAALGQRSNHSVGQLSGGMKRRLSLARALINKPKLIFLDEPTTALDPQAKHLIWERLLQLKRQGISLFLTTHFMDEAQRLADRVAVLDQGRIIEQGTPKELIEKHVGKMVLEVWGRQAAEWLSTSLDALAANRHSSQEHKVGSAGGLTESVRAKAAANGIQGVERRGESFFLQGDQAEFAFTDLKAQAPAEVEYLYRPGNLEDVFFRLTGRDLRDD
ncbi:MAG: ATP-binding cassette domain-containing protein [Limnobacter sp.]|nr:ATP-binding cassette domain-containing protein [Limnobacter sp.]